ncbi:MAG: AmmeMemoRadiSam system protein A [Thermoanaerobaculia bacterium]
MTASGERAAPLDDSALLTRLARNAIERELGRDVEPPTPPAAREAWLRAPAATFVTLELDGKLRGCIGSLVAKHPLVEDLAQNARGAAFEDPRFPPLTDPEFDGLSIEVSVLSEPVPIGCRSESELLASLRPGVDGLVLEYGVRRATFLPQVWEGLPAPAAFVAGLKRKAGLQPDFWSADLRFSRYTVVKYSEE